MVERSSSAGHEMSISINTANHFRRLSRMITHLQDDDVREGEGFRGISRCSAGNVRKNTWKRYALREKWRWQGDNYTTIQGDNYTSFVELMRIVC